MIPEKVGLKGITREGLDYEFTLVFDVDIKHHVTASKDRTGMFMDKPDFIVTDKIGERINRWCQSGKSVESVAEMIKEATTV